MSLDSVLRLGQARPNPIFRGSPPARCLAVVLSLIALASCDESQRSADVRRSYAVLRDQPLALGISPIKITAHGAEVVGDTSDICLPLGSGTPAPHTREQIRAEVQRFLGDATVAITATLGSKEARTLCGPSYQWTASSDFVAENEIAICFSLSCGDGQGSPGSPLEFIEVSADAPLEVLGVYWKSTNTFDTPAR